MQGFILTTREGDKLAVCAECAVRYGRAGDRMKPMRKEDLAGPERGHCYYCFGDLEITSSREESGKEDVSHGAPDVGETIWGPLCGAEGGT